MQTNRPQFYPNTSKPTQADPEALKVICNDLIQASKRGLELIATNYPAPQSPDLESCGNVFTGHLGKSTFDFSTCVFNQDIRGQVVSPFSDLR